MKVLTGEGYTQGRLLGILHEMWTTHLGRAVNVGDTVYASGNVVRNATTDEWGMLIDSDSQYFSLLPEVHQLRLVDIVEGDGWMDNPTE